jgi:hypothetical protein
MEQYKGQIYSGHIFKGVDKLTSKDELRPVFGQAIIENGNIVATDAHHLIKIPLGFFGLEVAEIEKLEGKCISTEVLQKLGTLKTSTQWGVTEQGFVIFKSNSLKPSLIYPLDSKDSEGKYPNYEAVIPTIPEEVYMFYFNPQLFLNIEKIFTTYNKNIEDLPYLETYGATRAILFRSKNSEFLGLIMPKKV